MRQQKIENGDIMNNKKRFKLGYGSLLCVLIVGAQSPAANAVQLEEVIVTAQKRAENLQDVPVAVTALTADLLADIGFNDLGDVMSQVPSLLVLTNTSPMNTTLFIRNISNAGNIPTFEPATGLFIDGAFRSRSGFGIGDLADVQAVEVLKGPQSTLYGKNVTAGLVSIRTESPTDSFESMAELTAGSDARKQFKGYLSGPVTDYLRARLSVVDSRNDALMENALGPDGDNTNSFAIRGQLAFDIGDQFRGRFIYGRSEKDMKPMTGDVFLSEANQQVILNAGGSLVIPNDASDRKVQYLEGNYFESEADDIILTLEYDIGSYTLTSISSYDDYHSLGSSDDVEQMSLKIGNFKDTQNGRSYSQELRIDSLGDGTLSWMAGVFAYDNKFTRGDKDIPEFLSQEHVEEYGSAIAFQLATQGLLSPPLATVPLLGVEGDRGDFYVTQDTRSYGVFGKWDIHFTDTWQSALGIRYSYEEKEASLTQSNQVSLLGCVPPANAAFVCGTVPNGNDFEDSESFDAVTGSFSTSYFPAQSTMIYGSIASGFKAGGYSLQNGKPEPADRPFDEERVVNYEIGAKTEFWDRRARINAAIFHTRYRDFQKASFAGLVFVINNAELVTVEGVEIDSTFILSERLTTTFNIGYFDSVYDKYTGGRCYYGREPDNELGQCDLSGERFAARIKGNLGITWTQPLASGRFYSRLDYRYVGEANVSATQDPRFDQPSLTLANLRLGWRNGRMDMALWGSNITDKVYITQAAPANIHAAIDRTLGSPEESYQLFTGEPRTWGLTTRFFF